MAFCFLGYSTWEGRVLYLEDLYVSPAHRRQGVSGLLFAAMARAARVARCARVQWTALEWNEPAVQAYRAPAIAAAEMQGWVIYRWREADIERAAQLPGVLVEG
jgi:GNAT superfamily N-acetyltransferase